jgi:phage shock protein PspC (stress-responsive transcriptional regulator)
MTMSRGLRKFALAVHLTFSVGWVGTVIAYLALAVAAETSQDAQTVRAAWTGMELTGWFVIVPLALASLLTGLVMALGTPWGLFRHYWVVISFGLTVFATVVLLLHMPSVSSNADLAREADAARLDTLGGDLAHPAIGLVVLLVIQVLNLYKPRGMTRYGHRKLHDQRRGQPDGQRPVAVP